MADDGGGSGVWTGHHNEEVDQGEDNLEIDLDIFLGILEEHNDPEQSTPEDLSFKPFELTPDVIQPDYSQTGHEVSNWLPSAADSRYYNTGSVGSTDYSHNWSMVLGDGKLKSLATKESHLHYSAGFEGRCSASQGYHTTDSVGTSQFEIPSCSTASNFASGDAKHVPLYEDGPVISFPEGESGLFDMDAGGSIESRYGTRDPVMSNFDGKLGCHGPSIGNGSEGFQVTETWSYKPLEMSFVGADGPPNNMTSATDSSLCYGSDFTSELSDHYSDMWYDSDRDESDDSPRELNGHHSDILYCTDTDDSLISDNSDQYVCGSHDVQDSPSKDKIMVTNEQSSKFPTENTQPTVKMFSSGQKGRNGYSVSDMPTVTIQGQNFKCIERNSDYTFCGNSSSTTDGRCVSNKAFMAKEQEFDVKNERYDGLLTTRRILRQSIEVIDESPLKNSSYGDNDLKQQYLSQLPALTSQELETCLKFEKQEIIVESKIVKRVDKIAGTFPVGAKPFGSACTKKHFRRSQPDCIDIDEKGNTIQSKCVDFNLLKVSPESFPSSSSDNKSQIDDDPDIYIIEDISQRARRNHSQGLLKTVAIPQPSTYDDSLHYNRVENTRYKTNDERLVFRVALQDLSQPTSEATPPDGVLAVPLLRHQRIALSWMIQKETSTLHCSGGILADDQGLGKTISMLALILKERPLSSGPRFDDVKQMELETFNLDDDEVSELDGRKKNAYCSEAMLNDNEMSKVKFLGQEKGRPAAGTLVVCPTSVLRQWADELRNKVTSEANLSVLVYHGSNRTKDPCELAKFDVVLTTYAIVSQEVPKQPLVDDEKTKAEVEWSLSKKRKKFPCAGKKNSKQKKGLDSLKLESITRPLAKVGWFRVVLDEAQSIKNYRTQVARACWGLRAKRRWCLSGTPIQNAIDDLYSYFRFLRYDPYASFKLFTITIKNPISRNPAKGYRKLQAVLKTIMLRRTKGTLLDGEPIISLPPRLVQLKKVDFTSEERDFYSRLEKSSRAQFKEYANAGTVKQNYVNILLMLLRLRQACDHPFLVKGVDSSSMWRSSSEAAKKLPREKQLFLLSCLEASSAICQMCHDSPEDAVVSICGHVFCNQCICEHFNGDDKQCPGSNCKTKLSEASVFTKTTLSSFISDQLAQTQSSDSSGLQLVEAVSMCSGGSQFNSSKIRAVLEILQSMSKTCDGALIEASSHSSSTYENSGRPVGEKAIVFSQWTSMLDLVEACLKNSSIQYRRLDGRMSILARDKAVKDFNTLPEVSVIIMSLKAASLGLNMVAACNVVLVDLWWNPTTEDQAIDRAHRIGQTRTVKVVRLTVKDTVEDRILALQQKKRAMVASAFGEDETGSRQTRLTEEDLSYLFMGDGY